MGLDAMILVFWMLSFKDFITTQIILVLQHPFICSFVNSMYIFQSSEISTQQGWHNGFPGGSGVKDLHANARGTGNAASVPGSGKSPGGGSGNPLQYSWLDNSMDRGAWQAAVHWVTQNWTQLTQLSRIFSTLVLEFEDFPHYFPWMSISFKISVFGCRGSPKVAEE